jgi:HSP20 family molecular chaperone IbpA
MSFLQRLKGRGVRSEQRLQSSEEETTLDDIVQLDVDVFQTDDLIVVYAHAAGADLNDIHVSIEGDADVVLIEGKRLRPEHIAFARQKPKGAFFTEECTWGDFYRRIILPESVDIANAEAKVKNGVLVLVLPLLRAEEKEKVKLKIKSVDRKKRRK